MLDANACCQTCIRSNFHVIKFGVCFKDDDKSIQGKRRKRATPRGRGRGATPSKRGRKADNPAIQRMLMGKDDDDDDDDDNVAKRLNKSQPRVGYVLNFVFLVSCLSVEF